MVLAACTAARARSRRSPPRPTSTHARSSRTSSARRDAVSVVFVRNTTEAINVLATALPPGHTSALARRSSTTRTCSPGAGTTCTSCRSPTSADELLTLTEAALAARRIDLLAVTGASNVTGEVWPLTELAALAHAHGAELFVDAAQLAPHRAIDMAARRHRPPRAVRPQALRAVRRRRARQPHPARRRPADPRRRRDQARHARRRDLGRRAGPLSRPGSPNVIGAVALAAACEALAAIGMDAVADRERALSAHLRTRPRRASTA